MSHAALVAAILAASQRQRLDLYTTPPAFRSLGAQTLAATPMDEAELSALLTRLLPDILAGVEQARAAFGDRKLSTAEAAALGTIVLGIVSEAVRVGAPLIKGTSAYALVGLIFGVVFDRVVAPLLPVWARPFAGLIKAGVLRGLESLYRTVIKRKPVPTP